MLFWKIEENFPNCSFLIAKLVVLDDRRNRTLEDNISHGYYCMPVVPSCRDLLPHSQDIHNDSYSHLAHTSPVRLLKLKITIKTLFSSI